MTASDGRRVVLVIEDDDVVRSFVTRRLEGENFAVRAASSGEHGLRLLDDSVDVVLLDVGLPGVDGFTVLRTIRQRSSCPVLMLTGAADEAARVLGLEIGADDYVVKPFLPRELIARVRALLRRADGTERRANSTSFGDVTIDVDANEVVRAGVRLRLTHKEYDLLAFLAGRPRQVFTREQLLRHVWNAEPGWQDPATVTEHIRRLRQHVEQDPAQPRHIVTVRGTGYRLDP